MKKYDRAYFQRWYHNRATRVNSAADTRRKAALAITLAEYFIRRQVRTVLDVGCGEGAWRQYLRSHRPRIAYTGIDSSDYVVERFGASRNIRKGAFGDLPSMKLGVYDLVICSDVLHYVTDAEIAAGIQTLADATDGVAFLEVLTREDDIQGDLDAFIRRPASWYRRTFRDARLTKVGPYCWLSPAFLDAVSDLETW